jgi:hypothetical protein
MLIAGPRHLQAVLDEYVAYYNRHLPNRARDLRRLGCGGVTTTEMARPDDGENTAAEHSGRTGQLIWEHGMAALSQPRRRSSTSMTG